MNLFTAFITTVGVLFTGFGTIQQHGLPEVLVTELIHHKQQIELIRREVVDSLNPQTLQIQQGVRNLAEVKQGGLRLKVSPDLKSSPPQHELE